ncbi:hypothetical protein Clacol_007593 [Clathrus columnatus]|uniref:Fcf2 pre-rRNA processing C-terminal domain-containing protein n=1 Tax=Clathrus columnatus TaxID=1419009 RepID=A0AAV5ALM3_9AGAM|nr:hypothetical protein Clacol_007593 [Clathrus columnatus]
MQSDSEIQQQDEEEQAAHSSSSSSDSSSSYDDDSESENDSESDSITSEYLVSLLEKAKANIREKKGKQRQEEEEVEENNDGDILLLEKDDEDQPLPALDPGPSMPKPYFVFGNSRTQPGLLVRDIEVEKLEKSAPSEPAAPPPPLPLNKDNKPLTKKQRKEQRRATAGPAWFDLPAPDPAELPKLYREVEAVRLRNALDPKRFYRKDEGEGKGIKGLPKYFAIGTILPSKTPFGTTSGDNLPKSHRKRTIVDELVDDAEAKRYAKKKFSELQGVREAAGRNTLHRKRALRQKKW